MIPPGYKKDAFLDSDDDDGISTIPFTEQPAFPRGLWRHPIKFVSAGHAQTVEDDTKERGRAFAAQYIALCFPNGLPEPAPSPFPICDICKAPVSEPNNMHAFSLVHKLALPMVHAPSAIDRARLGLKVMEKHGFDVDSRLGLGAQGQGMLFPVKVKEKRDKCGLGFVAKKAETKPKEVKLGAGQIRKMAAAQKKKDEKIHRAFYAEDNVEKYLNDLGC
ncbi:hypothetical protein BDV95DRAFT_497502 [Massariosphaeria phaeospora]|uniref:G-patch domain-containing protein n=1 Tax=Massariosphaeria phaeospora TaxID=100035 RepID=A0A7C8I3C9_9PLEO|nr:hypothetical protein BDV95DRAFT_497502 [Massariosphaeria phaeospora]